MRSAGLARGQSLALVIPSSSPSHDVLRLAGVSQHVEMAETVEEALSGA